VYCSTVNDDFTNVFKDTGVKDKDGIVQYSIPFKYCSNWGSQNEWLEAKNIYGRFKNSKPFKLTFEYYFTGYPISPGNLTVMMNLFSLKSDSAREKIRYLKNDATDAATKYALAKSSFESAAKGAAAMDAQITDAQKKAKELESTQKADQKASDNLAASIVAKAAELSALQTEQTNKLTTISNRATEITASAQQVSDLTSQKGKDDTTALKTKLDEKLAIWNKAKDAISAEQPDSGTGDIVKSAHTELVEKNDVEKCKTLIATVKLV